MSKIKRVRTKQNPLNIEMCEIAPMTEGQAEAIKEYSSGKNLLLCGYAGTGKTFLACSLAADEIRRGEKERIHIFRSSVPTRDIGFLPGTEREKMEVFEKAYQSMFREIFDRGDAWEILKVRNLVSFESTSFLRGTTFNDCILIIDECQNMSEGEINTLMTRVGKNCRIILCGDQRQADLSKAESGYRLLHKVLTKMKNCITIIEFGIDDIVRSGFVKSWIIALESVKDEESKRVSSPS